MSSTPSSSSGLSFTQGFLLGQVSVCVLIFAFIKFFIFGEPPSERSSSSSGPHLSTLSPRHRRSFTATTAASSWIEENENDNDSSRFPGSTSPRSRKSRLLSSSHIIRPPLALTPALILRKTFYNVPHHQPESLDWFNVLVAQTIAQLRTDAVTDNAILRSLTAIVNGPSRPDFISDINVTEIALGDDFPIFSNCRVHPVDDGDGGGGRLEARMDVDLSDFITLGIETCLVLNYPRPRTAVLPVALSVSVVRFSGTLSISFLPATSGTDADIRLAPGAAGNAANAGPTSTGQSIRTPTTLAFAFMPNYTLSLSTRSLLGARSRLQDIPKIAQLVESRLRTWFEERCVLPRRQQIVIPSLWPRMRNVVDERDRPGTATATPAANTAADWAPEDEHAATTPLRTRTRTTSEWDRRNAAASTQQQDGPSSPSPGGMDGGLRYRANITSQNRMDQAIGADRIPNTPSVPFDIPGTMPGTMVS